MNKESNIVTEEIKVRAAVREPPGDRWKCVFDGANDSIIFDSLIDSLEYIFQKTGSTQFFMDSKKGITYIINTEETVIPPTPIKTFSLYGEN